MFIFKKKIVLGILLLAILAGLPSVIRHYKWALVTEAAAGYPTQAGGTTAKLGGCQLSGTTCISLGANPMGSALCASAYPDCNLYYVVDGNNAGGTILDFNTQPLFLTIAATTQAGLMPGGQFIFGGTTANMKLSPTNVVLAGNSGCFGCTAKLSAPKNLAYEILNTLDNFIIAGKEKIMNKIGGK